MGFWGGLGRFIQGKPVFEANSTSSQQKTINENSATQPLNGHKDIPIVKIEETETHNNGLHTRVTARIANRSAKRIELDKIDILGVRRELDTWLNPHEEREFNVYEGNRPNHRNYKDARLDYRDESGDYFRTNHVLEYDAQESDGTYSIRRIRYYDGSLQDI